MKQDRLLVSLLYQFLGVSSPENNYMEIVKALVVPLPPDAPGDSQFVYTSLSPEPIQPVIAPGSSFLGRLIWLLPANLQLT